MMILWRKTGRSAATRVLAMQSKVTAGDIRACTVLLARRGMAGEGSTTGRRSHTDEMGTAGLMKDTMVKGAPPGTSQVSTALMTVYTIVGPSMERTLSSSVMHLQGVEDLPPGNPVEKLATGVTGGVKKAVETVKEVIDRDRDQSVEIGDQGKMESGSWCSALSMRYAVLCTTSSVSFTPLPFYKYSVRQPARLPESHQGGGAEGEGAPEPRRRAMDRRHRDTRGH